MARCPPVRYTLWWLLLVLWQTNLSKGQEQAQCQNFQSFFVNTAQDCYNRYTGWTNRYLCLMQMNPLHNLVSCVANEGSTKIDNKLCQDPGSLDGVPDAGTTSYYPTGVASSSCVSPRKVILNGAVKYCKDCFIAGYVKACPFDPDTDEFLSCLCDQGLDYEDFNCLSHCFGFGKSNIGPEFPLKRRNNAKWCPLWDEQGRQPSWNRRNLFGAGHDDSSGQAAVGKRAQPPPYQFWAWGSEVIAWDNTTNLMYPCAYDRGSPNECKLGRSLPYVDSRYDTRNKMFRRCVVHPSEPSQACWSVYYSGTVTTPASNASASQLAQYSETTTSASFTPPTATPTVVEQQTTFQPDLTSPTHNGNGATSPPPHWVFVSAMMAAGLQWLV